MLMIIPDAESCLERKEKAEEKVLDLVCAGYSLMLAPRVLWDFENFILRDVIYFRFRALRLASRIL